MRTPTKIYTVVALLTLSTTLYASPAQAHSAATFYPNRWAANTDHNYGFGTGYPSGNYRYRTTDGKNQWNDVGGTNEPDFFAYLADASLTFGSPCNSANSGILWFNRPAGVLGEVTLCISGSGQLLRFSLAIDPDTGDGSGGYTWYTGTGDAPSNTVDLWSVATHEFGHVTGWRGHFGESDSVCPNSSARHTMCPSIYPGTERQRTLQDHDRHTFDNAY